MSKDLEGISFQRVKGLMVEGVCELCSEPVRGALCLGWGLVPEGRCLIIAVMENDEAHPLCLVAEKHIPNSVEIET